MQMKFRRVPVQIAGEVPEVSGAGTRQGPGKFRRRCFVKFQRAPMCFSRERLSAGFFQ